MLLWIIAASLPAIALVLLLLRRKVRNKPEEEIAF
jgi:hypothetical protein